MLSLTLRKKCKKPKTVWQIETEKVRISLFGNQKQELETHSEKKRLNFREEGAFCLLVCQRKPNFTSPVTFSRKEPRFR